MRQLGATVVVLLSHFSHTPLALSHAAYRVFTHPTSRDSAALCLRRTTLQVLTINLQLLIDGRELCDPPHGLRASRIGVWPHRRPARLVMRTADGECIRREGAPPTGHDDPTVAVGGPTSGRCLGCSAHSRSSTPFEGAEPWRTVRCAPESVLPVEWRRRCSRERTTVGRTRGAVRHSKGLNHSGLFAVRLSPPYGLSGAVLRP